MTETTARILPGDAVIAMPEVRCTSTRWHCNGGDCDQVVPAVWHDGGSFSGVVKRDWLDGGDVYTLTVQRSNGSLAFVPYDRCRKVGR